MKKSVIIEDEILTAQNLCEMLASVAPEYEVVAILQSIEESIVWFGKNTDYQLVFMDIQVADGIVFELFETVDVLSPIIFTTAYDKYAVQAFKVNSVDYLLKPVSEDELGRAIEKLKRMERQMTASPLSKDVIEQLRAKLTGNITRCFLSVAGDRMVPLGVADTAFFVVEKHQLTAVDYNGRQYRLDFSMDELVTNLNPNDFYRANRQFVVAHKAIREIIFSFGGKLELRLDVPTPERIFVSRAKAKEFKLWYSKLNF